MTLLTLVVPLKALSPNTVALEVRVSMYAFEEGHNLVPNTLNSKLKSSLAQGFGVVRSHELGVRVSLVLNSGL